MSRFPIPPIAAALVPIFLTASAQAATFDIGATANMSASFSIEMGAPHPVFDIPLGSLTALGADTSSAVDDPAATHNDGNFSQIGGYLAPTIQPFIYSEFDETTQPDGDSARGLIYLESTITAASDGTGRPASFDRVLEASSTLSFGDLTADASAQTSHEIGRELVITNTDSQISYGQTARFNYDLSLAATADDVGTQSTAEAIFAMTFNTSGTVIFEDPYQTAGSSSFEDSDPGASYSQSLVTSNALFNGAYLTAGVTALGTGSPTHAALQTSGSFYIYFVVGPNASVRFDFFQSEATQSSYVAPDRPGVPEVPLPASALALLSGLGALRLLRRRPS